MGSVMAKVQSNENILSDGQLQDTLGARISKAREQSGLNLTTAAKLAGIKRETLKSWEIDASEPRVAKLNMLAGIFGVSVTYFLADEGHKGELEEENISREEMLRSLQTQFQTIQESQRQLSDALAEIGQSLARLK